MEEQDTALAATSVGELFVRHLGNRSPAMRFGLVEWSWDEVARECMRRARWLRDLRALNGGVAQHVGILLDNGPEYVFLLGGTAVSGDICVSLNTSRAGAQLAVDIDHTATRIVVTDAKHRHQLQALPDDVMIVQIEDAPWAGMSDAPVALVAGLDDLYLMMFTSGSTGQPKAVRHSHGHLLRRGRQLQAEIALSEKACVYLPMPMFHANTVVGLLLPAVMAGAVIATRPTFSVSGFLDDVRKFGATHATYIGKTLQFILAQSEDGVPKTSLELLIGNGASDREIGAFAYRFGCRVVDVYGSTEGAISLRRTETTPRGALGVAAAGDVRIMHPATGRECPRGRVDRDGRVTNLAEAVGEIVRVDGTGNFEGYWNNDAAQAERVRDGMYWSGDLAWRDEDGYFYFAGRSGGMVRVDGENLSAHRVQDIVEQHPHIAQCVAYGVPDPGSDDALMLAVRLVHGGEIDPSELFAYWDGSDRLSRKEIPRFMRFVDEIPRTATNKLLTVQLQSAAWHGRDPIWWRPSSRDSFRRLEEADIDVLDREIAGRADTGRMSG